MANTHLSNGIVAKYLELAPDVILGRVALVPLTYYSIRTQQTSSAAPSQVLLVCVNSIGVEYKLEWKGKKMPEAGCCNYWCGYKMRIQSTPCDCKSVWHLSRLHIRSVSVA